MTVRDPEPSGTLTRRRSNHADGETDHEQSEERRVNWYDGWHPFPPTMTLKDTDTAAGWIKMRVSLVCFLVLLLAVACAPTGPEPRPRHVQPLSAGGTVYVTSNGWHSGIVLSREILTPNWIPEAADFPAARYLEFGWGDAEYYPAKTPSIAEALRAGLLPTPAVMHVAALGMQPRASSSVEVVALTLDAAQLGRLIGYIDGSFERGADRRAVSSGPGLYPNSRFYPARGRFHLANTCNTWTARALAATGLPVDETEAALAEDLMAQIRPLVAP